MPSRTRCAPTAAPMPQAISRRSRRRAATTASAATPNAIAAISHSAGITTCTLHIARAPDGAARGVEQAEAIEDVAGGGSKRDRGEVPAERRRCRCARRVVEPRPVAEHPEPDPEPRLGEQHDERDEEDPAHDRLDQRQPKDVETRRRARAAGPRARSARRRGSGPRRPRSPAKPIARKNASSARQRPAQQRRAFELGERRVQRRAGRLAPAVHQPQGPAKVEPEVERQREEGRGEQREAQIDDLPEHGPIAERSHPEPVDCALGQPERRDECQKAADDPPAQPPRRWAGWSR